MATANLADLEPNLTECPVCHDTFTVPKLLPCSHILCRQCLVTWLQSQPQAACPLCRYTIVDPVKQGKRSVEEVADGFPTDLAMTAMVEAETLLSKQHVCCVCVDVAAVALCLQCGDMYCQHCSNVHKKMTMSKEHEVEQLTSLTTEKLAAYGPVTCSEHKEKLCELYCTTHNTSLCMLCANTVHRQCPELISQQSLVSTLTTELSQLDNQVANALATAEDDITLLDKHVKDMESDCQATLNKIKIVFDRLKAAIDSRFLKLQNTAKKMVYKCTAKATDLKQCVVLKRSRLATHKKFINLYKAFTEHKYFKDMVTLIKGQVDEIDKVYYSPQLNDRLVVTFDQQVVEDLEMKLSHLGDITLASCGQRLKGHNTFTTAVAQGQTPSTTTVAQGQTPSTSTVAQGQTPSTTKVGQGQTPSTTKVGQGQTPSTTAIRQGQTPSTTAVRQGQTPSTTTVEQGQTPSTSTVAQGQTPSTTTVAQGKTPSTSTVAQGQTPSTTKVDQGQTPSTTKVAQGQTPSTTAVRQVQTTSTTTVGQGQIPSTKTVGQGQTLTVVKSKALVKTTVAQIQTPATTYMQGQASVKSSIAQDQVPITTTVVFDTGQSSEFDPMTAILSDGVDLCSGDLQMGNVTCIVSDPSSDELYIANYNNFFITVLSVKSDRVIANIKLDKKPLEIAIVQERLLAVTTTENVILLIDFSTLSKPRVHSRLVTEKKYRGITVVGSKSLLVSCNKYSGTACVDEITLAGKWVRTIVSSDTLPGLNLPDGLYADTQRDVLYIADLGTNCVFRVQLSTGRVQGKLTHPDMSGPTQVCTDRGGNLYVVSTGGSCILVKSLRDQWRVLFKNECFPFSVSVKDNSLFISSHGGIYLLGRYDFINP